jgi:predicted dehydrogenase
VRILIAGAGSIGRRHLGNLQSLGEDDLLVLRSHAVPVPGAETVPVVTDLEQALAAKPDLVLVCTPAPDHLTVALAALEAGCHLFVEKPLSDSWEGVEELQARVRAAGRLGMAGFDLRFDPGLRRAAALIAGGALGRVMSVHAQVGQYLPDWRPDTDYRKGVTARSDLGGGVILELVHELDLVAWLAGPVTEVGCFAQRVSELEMDAEDLAVMTLRFASGALGTVHLDCLDRIPVRIARVSGSDGSLVWDGLARTLDWRCAGGEGQRYEWSGVDRSARFVEEMRCLLGCVRDGGSPPVDLEGAAATLRVALAARRAAETGRTWRPEEIV